MHLRWPTHNWARVEYYLWIKKVRFQEGLKLVKGMSIMNICTGNLFQRIIGAIAGKCCLSMIVFLPNYINNSNIILITK